MVLFRHEGYGVVQRGHSSGGRVADEEVVADDEGKPLGSSEGVL